MNKIRFIASQDTNYIFHMLSVAKCGYDNKYGDSYKHFYPQHDLDLLKQYEQMISVCGGKHCGELYGILVCEAAAAAVSAKEYYTRLVHEFYSNDGPPGLESYHNIICQIAEVMIKHYDHYVINIWDREQSKITKYIPAVLQLFEESNFTEKAEEVIGCSLLHDCFTATLVTSVENGAEAIDITDEQDVFGIERTPLDAFYFIGHEYIIYLLFNALKEENAFRELNTWNITEGLAEYYLKQVLGNTRFFNTHRKYVAFFEETNRQKQFNAVALYRKGLEAFSKQ